MTEPAALLSLLLLTGLVIVIAMVLKALLLKSGLPSLLGFILLGLGLRLTADSLGGLDELTQATFRVLAQLGVVMLLFRVGLLAELSGLLKQLKRASVIWFWTVVLSGGLGFIVSYTLLGLALLPSLFVATALTATSVGVTVSVWQEAGRLRSPDGELLLDVAELDDISAIILMALLLTLAPLVSSGQTEGLLAAGLITALWFVAKGALFAGLCYLFGHFAERPLTRFFERLERPPDPMLTVIGIGMMFAALAGFLGFSVAIGAFFAGLVFSRDPHAVAMDSAFATLYDFFTPFFFIGVGLQLEPAALLSGTGLGAALFGAAVLGKLLGAGLPTLFLVGKSSALLLGLSMIPRAEIALIIVEQGRRLGSWAVPPEVFAAMITVVLTTCLVAPLALRPLLKSAPHTQPEARP